MRNFPEPSLPDPFPRVFQSEKTGQQRGRDRLSRPGLAPVAGLPPTSGPPAQTGAQVLLRQGRPGRPDFGGPGLSNLMAFHRTTALPLWLHGFTCPALQQSLTVENAQACYVLGNALGTTVPGLGKADHGDTI